MKRAIGFAFLLYIITFVIYIVLASLGLISTEEYSLTAFIIGWVLNVPVVLLLAKWYFKKEEPTAKKGFYLGIVTIVISLILDGLAVLGTLAAGQSIAQFQELYSSWPLYVTIAEIVLLTTYAGYEFDGTYSPPDSKTL